MTPGSVTCRRLRESGKPVTARMELAQPRGCRSCRDGNHEPGYGGDWENSRDIQGCTGFYDELNQLVALMFDVDRHAFRVELRDRMERAERGTLTYGRKGDVEQVSRADVVLELRHLRRRDVSEQPHNVRLYFTEPMSEDGQLLTLKIAWKTSDKKGKLKQNDQIDEAQRRADEHAQWRATR